MSDRSPLSGENPAAAAWTEDDWLDSIADAFQRIEIDPMWDRYERIYLLTQDDAETLARIAIDMLRPAGSGRNA